MIFTLSFVSVSIAGNKTPLSLKPSKEIVGKKTYIVGKTNLPTGTRIGVEITGAGYTAQDFKITINNDGSFKSEGFTNRGNFIIGNYTVDVFLHNNPAWQSENLRAKIANYEGHGIESGKMSLSMNVVNTTADIQPGNSIEKAFDDIIIKSKTKTSKCDGIVALTMKYNAKEVYDAYDFIDYKYPGLIDSCDQ